jgi:pre-rRNA-processing protein TSR3
MMTEGFQTRILALQMGQDDPKKCTSAKLCRMKLATPIPNARRIPRDAIVLNPSVEEVFSLKDRPNLKHGLVAIDCSWKYAEQVFNRRFKGLNRRLPILLAGNPINYAKQGKLSSAEAVSAALYIAGYIEHSKRIISLFKWGPTFLTLNHDPLEEYRLAETSEEVRKIEDEYFKP